MKMKKFLESTFWFVFGIGIGTIGIIAVSFFASLF
jgi:hypothetical protein